MVPPLFLISITIYNTSAFATYHQSNKMNSEAKQLCKSVINAGNIDFSRSSYDFEDGNAASTVDATCIAASVTKSNAVQTERCQVKKFKNKTTATDSKVKPIIKTTIDESDAHVCDIHAIITLNVVARSADDNQTVSVLSTETNDPSTAIKSKNTKQCSKCTCTIVECAQTGGCVDSCKEPCKYGGFGPCNAFSLGTADYRMLLREKCNTMLIGGCRVPVCRNFKNKL